MYYTYNAEGSRQSVANSYGTFSQSNDGVDATSPLLWDGQVLHTPGEYNEDTSGTNLYSEPDALGSSAAVLSSADGTDATYEYDAFGNQMDGSGSLPVSYPFDQGFGAGAGYTEEAGTGGLVRCGNRYYNPYFGRFLTQDPSGDGLNWYAYCDNDPTDALDPSGLFAQGGSSPDTDYDFEGYSEGEGDGEGRLLLPIPLPPVYSGGGLPVNLSMSMIGLDPGVVHVIGRAISQVIHEGFKIYRDHKIAKAKEVKKAQKKAAKDAEKADKKAAKQARLSQSSRKSETTEEEDEQHDTYQEERIETEQNDSNAGRGSDYNGVPTNPDDDK